MQHPRYRKRVKHPPKPGVSRELTFSCYRRFPLLRCEDHAQMLSDAIDQAKKRNRFDLLAFVYMPEHVHLIVHPNQNDAPVSALLKAIKRPHSFRIKQRMIQTNDPWLGRLTIRERPGVTTFRFWQEGSGYDRDITSGRYLREVINYVHMNPVRRGLCDRPEQWRWSSWHQYNGSTIPAGLPSVDGMPDADLVDQG